jgi:hypothetical protein
VAKLVRLIPERTIDSSFAFEIVTALPHSTLWSPSNTKGSWDHEVSVASGRTLIFECKAVDTGANSWRIPINRTQLGHYVSIVPNALYVLPAQPRFKKPWNLRCLEGGCSVARGCIPCQVSYPWVPRRSAVLSPRLARASQHIAFQPWFNHWAWCVTAADLQRHLPLGSASLSGRDIDHASIPGSIRFCHLLEQLQSIAAGRGASRTAATWFTDGAALADLAGMLRELATASEENGSTPPHLVAL